MKNGNFDKIKYFVLLHAILFLYALTAVCSKFASKLPFFSFKWMLLYALMIFVLGIYAVLWQQVLKYIPLNVAYANKAITIAWNMLFGILIFKEGLPTVNNLIGAAIVFVGIIIMVTSSEPKKNSDDTKSNASFPEAGKDGDGQ